MSNNSDHIEIYEPIKNSDIELSLINIINNIKKLNLYNINQSSFDKVCNYFDLTNRTEIDELIRIVLILIRDLYCNPNSLDSFNIPDINQDLFNNTIKNMKKLKIIGNDNVFYHLKKHELYDHINFILVLISIRINCKDKYIDTKSLIILYYSLSCLYLLNRQPKNIKSVKKVINYKLVTKINKNDIKHCCLNHCSSR